MVGTRLGLDVLAADLDPDDDGGRGHTHFAPAGMWFQPGRGTLSARERDFVERVVTTFMAGFAAEEAFGEADPDGSGYDVDLAVREWLGYLEPDPRRRPPLARRFYARAQSELAGPEARRAVERVAAALLAEHRLDGDRARALAEGTG